MTERINESKSTEIQVGQIYDRVTQIVDMYGMDYDGKGKKAVAVFNKDTDESKSCITIGLFAGRTPGEVKAIYTNEKFGEGSQRVEYSFRRDGSFEKRVLRDRQITVERKYKTRSSLEEVYRVKRISNFEFLEIDNFLNGVEDELKKQPREIPCEDNLYTPTHKHLVRVKRRPHRR